MSISQTAARRIDNNAALVAPCSIPLPPSPIMEPHDIPDTSVEARNTRDDKASACAQVEPSSLAPQVHTVPPPAPKTPRTVLSVVQASAVHQTPISALVESIRDGFGLSSLDTLDEESPDDVWYAEGAKHVSPLSWHRKGTQRALQHSDIE